MNEDSDNEIMQRVRDGELEDLSILYQRYHVMLFAFFIKHTRQKSLSEDLVQEVFLRIMKYRGTYRPGQPFVSWLFSIARNTKNSAHRKHTKGSEFLHAPLHEDDPTKHEGVSTETLPNDELDKKLKTELLYEALELMTPENRQLIVLRRIQHLHYPEIANLLNCEMGALRVRTHRAFTELKSHYQKLLRKHSNELSVF